MGGSPASQPKYVAHIFVRDHKSHSMSLDSDVSEQQQQQPIAIGRKKEIDSNKNNICTDTNQKRRSVETSGMSSMECEKPQEHIVHSMRYAESGLEVHNSISSFTQTSSESDSADASSELSSSSSSGESYVSENYNVRQPVQRRVVIAVKVVGADKE
jgi:hypothetical protein